MHRALDPAAVLRLLRASDELELPDGGQSAGQLWLADPCDRDLPGLIAHFAETGGRVEGEPSWINCASSETPTLYTAHEKRGCDGIDAAGVLPGFRGTAVHDGWAPYRVYEKARHALCGAHRVRELACAKEQGQVWASAMSALLLDVKDAVWHARQAGRDALDHGALGIVHDCYREIIARKGAERFLAIRSYLSTARKQGQRPVEVLTKLTAGEPWLADGSRALIRLRRFRYSAL